MLERTFNQEDFAELIEKSRQHPRKRAVKVIHPAETSGMRCIVNCIQPDSYVAPHFHPFENSRELWILEQGKMGVLIFDENGDVNQTLTLCKSKTKLIEIPERVMHSAVSLEEDSVMYELSHGPYVASDYKIFPKWALKESANPQKISEYLSFLKSYF